MTLSAGSSRATRAARDWAGAYNTGEGNGQVPLLGALSLALAIRLAGLNFQSFSMDEVTDLEIARLPVEQIAFLADGFPPLYHLLLKGWLMVWGTPLAARWLSVLLGLVTVYAVYQLAIGIAGRPTAVAASVLTAISPLHVWFAQESRAYALALPLAAVAHWRFREAHTTNTWRNWLSYGGVALAAVCTHYFLAIVIALQALWLLPRLIRRTQDRLQGVAVYGLLAVATLPVLFLLRPDLTYQSGTGDGRVGLDALLYSFYAFLLGFATGPSVRELHDMDLRQAARGFLPWIIALAVCLLPLCIQWLRRPRPTGEATRYLLLAGLGPLVVTVAAAASFDLKYKVSYVSWASIPLLVLLGDVFVRAWGTRWGRLHVAGYFALAFIALGSRHLVYRHWNEDVRSLATYLEAHSSRETPVFVVAGYMADPLAFYLGASWSVEALPKAPAALGSVVELTSGNAPAPAWIVYARPFDGDPTGEIRSSLNSGRVSHLTATFPGIELYQIKSADKGPAS